MVGCPAEGGSKETGCRRGAVKEIQLPKKHHIGLGIFVVVEHLQMSFKCEKGVPEAAAGGERRSKLVSEPVAVGRYRGS